MYKLSNNNEEGDPQRTLMAINTTRHVHPPPTVGQEEEVRLFI